ncbi:hypothetical protein KCU67_g32, partial [Aureobasidium melanogenum]
LLAVVRYCSWFARLPSGRWCGRARRGLGVVVVGCVGVGGRAYDFDQLVLEGTGHCDDGGVVRATDKGGGVGHDAKVCYLLDDKGGFAVPTFVSQPSHRVLFPSSWIMSVPCCVPLCACPCTSPSSSYSLDRRCLVRYNSAMRTPAASKRPFRYVHSWGIPHEKQPLYLSKLIVPGIPRVDDWHRYRTPYIGSRWQRWTQENVRCAAFDCCRRPGLLETHVVTAFPVQQHSYEAMRPQPYKHHSLPSPDSPCREPHRPGIRLESYGGRRPNLVC